MIKSWPFRLLALALLLITCSCATTQEGTTTTNTSTSTSTTTNTNTNTSTNTSTSTTTTTLPPPVFSFTPFTSSAEVFIRGQYSATHNGIDIFDAFSTVEAEFRAVCGGTFTKTKFHNGVGRWQVNCMIVYDSNYIVMYAFEPFGADNDEAPADTQYGMLIADGTTVESGQALGRLLYVGDGAHVHFGITKNFSWECPMPYFTTAASEEMLVVFRLTETGQPICTDHNLY
jgi:hypothetical protein